VAEAHTCNAIHFSMKYDCYGKHSCALFYKMQAGCLLHNIRKNKKLHAHVGVNLIIPAR
jgi:hypothetical protein